MLGGEFYFFLVASFESEQRNAVDGRIFQLFAEFNLLFVKTHEIVPPRVLDRRMKRRERLHKNFALHVAATGASGNLREKLEGAFARSQIRLMQRGGRVKDDHE